MDQLSRLDILKGALLLEYRGMALYESAVKTTENPEVKSLFSMLVNEEIKHIEVLRKHLSQVQNQSAPIDYSELDKLFPRKTDPILSKDIIRNVHGAGYEAAVISAALDFEKKAVEYYSDQASRSEDQGEKTLFKWLTNWEVGHMQMLADLDRELKEKIWNDNQFWPLD
ncbi:MAG: ferritin family protein [Candidatus Aminicenantes bacterium]|nr:ferritin family protein [Candidatus Aminicenantes bacterium]